MVKVIDWKLIKSKWFAYLLIGLTFFGIVVVDLYYLSIGNELAREFLPETIGWFITFMILTFFLELREEIESKSIEERVKRRINRHTHNIFIELGFLCHIKRILTGNVIDDPDAWKKLKLEQFDTMTTKPIRLDRRAIKLLFTNNNARLQYVSLFDKYESYLADLESRYYKFLDSDIQSSLMDIQEYLHQLRFTLTVRVIPEYSDDSIESVIGKRQLDFEHEIENIISKIMKEIQFIRQDLGIELK
jgi:hypothetical protein